MTPEMKSRVEARVKKMLESGVTHVLPSESNDVPSTQFDPCFCGFNPCWCGQWNTDRVLINVSQEWE